MFPTVSQLPSKIVVNMNMNPNDVDNRLLAGDAQVDFAGTGVQAAARAKILSNPNLKAQPDDPITGFGWFFYIDSQVAPFTNLPAAGNRVRDQPPHDAERLRRPGGRRRDRQHGHAATVAGYKKFDLYEATTKTQGAPAKAKQALQQCGQPNGFSTGIAYRSDRPTETQGAQALQQALSAVGIKTLHGYPSATYFTPSRACRST
jgi:Bacterial extracellular solute-binding proteins, family 5 Middle.